MFLLLLYSLIIHLTVTQANPFHKYPYVFLLDIGNEELQTSSEQIRVSIPGGSLALKYPAVGEGDSIAHVRVCGIDFGTDLKASIVDGGPGYKYVVIVFMGNPGQAYDAVVTVSTLDNGKDETEDAESVQTEEVRSSYKVAEDSDEDKSNDSAEAEEHNNPREENNEQLTSASNFYDSAENIEINGKEDESDDDVNVNKDEVVNTEEDSKELHNDNADVQDYAEAKDQEENQDYDDNNAPKAERYSASEENNADKNNQGPRELDRNLYYKYNALKPHSYDDGNIYPQEVNNAENEVDYSDDNDNREVYSLEDPAELDQMFNDEEVHNDGEKYTDSNNNDNYPDADERSAVAY